MSRRPSRTDIALRIIVAACGAFMIATSLIGLAYLWGGR